MMGRLWTRSGQDRSHQASPSLKENSASPCRTYGVQDFDATLGGSGMEWSES